MHGLIFTELQKYVMKKYDFATWQLLLLQSGLGDKLYLPTQVYPDKEVFGIVTTASKVTGLEVAVILEDFGKFLVPDLVKVFASFVKPEWKTLDMLENIENTIHKAVRAKEPQATPPKLVCKRIASNKVEIIYTSNRKICPLAIGLIKGVAEHYDETIRITEPTCMLRGDDQCKILVEK
jgi:predicted hydrocarbon binding protein